MHPAGLILALAFASNPAAAELPTVSVDILEVSHYFGDDGKETLCQVIAWSWSPRTDRHEIRGWQILKDIGDFPRPVDGHWEAHWKPNRIVRATHFKESYWNFDIEVVERKRTPADQRIPLFVEGPVVKEGNDPLPPAPEGMR